MSESNNPYSGPYHGLILPDGYKEFNKRREMWDVKRERDDRPNFTETGFAPTQEAQREEIGNPRGWVLPHDICIDHAKPGDCGPMPDKYGTIRPPVGGIWVAGQSYPEVDLRRGDVVVYRCCFRCYENEQDGLEIVLPDGLSRQERRTRNMFDILKSMKLRGYRPVEGGA